MLKLTVVLIPTLNCCVKVKQRYLKYTLNIYYTTKHNSSNIIYIYSSYFLPMCFYRHILSPSLHWNLWKSGLENHHTRGSTPRGSSNHSLLSSHPLSPYYILQLLYFFYYYYILLCLSLPLFDYKRRQLAINNESGTVVIFLFILFFRHHTLSYCYLLHFSIFYLKK